MNKRGHYWRKRVAGALGGALALLGAAAALLRWLL